MEERMNDYLVKIYYFTSLFRPRIHFSIGSIYSNESTNMSWDQYIMSKSQCRTDLYEQDFLLESDQSLEFVFCSDHQNDQDVKWENPRTDQKQKLAKGNNFYINKTGIYAIFQGYIVPVTQPKLNDKVILFTDIDGTLYGKPEIHDNFKKYFISHGFFCNPNLTLIYSTGRGLEKFKDILQKGSLIYPDILVTSCGSEIYTLSNTQQDFETNPFKMLEDWSSYITQDNWDEEVMKDFVLHQFPNIQVNHNEGFSKYKGSFILKEEDARKTDILDYIVKKAAQEINQNWKYVISGCGSHRFIDILPERADKGTSLQYICSNVLNCDSSKSVAFGDSLNDIDMLISAGQGVIVGNAQSDLLAWHEENFKKYQTVSCSPYEEGDAILRFLQKISKDIKLGSK